MCYTSGMGKIPTSHVHAWTHSFDDPVHWAQVQVRNYFKYGRMRKPRFGDSFEYTGRSPGKRTFHQAREHDRAKWAGNPEGYAPYFNDDLNDILTQ